MSRNCPNSDGRGAYADGYYEDEGNDYHARNATRHEPPPRQPPSYAILAHRSLAPVASCAVEALNMLLQGYQMPLPPIEFKTTRDAGGRSIFHATVQVKSCIASAKEYSKKLCKQAVCHQLLINLRQRYPKLIIPLYEPPQTVLTRFIGTSADICDLAEEVSTMELDERDYGNVRQAKRLDDAPKKSTARKRSEMAELSHLVTKFEGISPPQYLDVTNKDNNTGTREVLCKLGCEVVKAGHGYTQVEAQENSAGEMLKLLGQVDTSATFHDFQVSGDTKNALEASSARIEYKLTQRNSNACWATQINLEAYGTGENQKESLITALQKVKTILEDTLNGMVNSTSA